MEYSKEKQEQIKQLQILYDNYWAKHEANKKIIEKKKELIDVDTKIDKFKKESPELPKFISTYRKLKSEFNKPNVRILNKLSNLYLIVYILLGIFLVGWSGFKIFSYCGWEAFGAILGFEIILVVCWVIGGFILHWFKE